MLEVFSLIKRALSQVFPFYLVKFSQNDYSAKLLFIASSIMGEAVTQKCSVKKVLLKILQNLHENACVSGFSLEPYQRGILAKVFLCEFGGFLKRPFRQNISHGWFCTAHLELLSKIVLLKISEIHLVGLFQQILPLPISGQGGLNV